MSRRPAATAAASQTEGWNALLGEVQAPLSSALDRLAAHASDIEDAWRRNVARLAFGSEELSALSALSLVACRPQVRTARFDEYAAALTRAGEALALRGVPETRAVAALAAQLETALPYLVDEPAGELAAALVRLAFAGGLSLTAGYANARATSWRSFGEQERLRLSRDLHDEIGHHLVVLKLYLGMISADLARARPARIRERLDEATDLVSQAIQSVRRLILDLGPIALEGVGLLPAIKLYARQFTARTGVKVRVRDRGLSVRLPPGHETALYRLLQGALSNVLKHARARHVNVVVGTAGGSAVEMTIEDDGIGFDTSVPRQAFGLAAMRHRVASLGGRLRVESRTAGRRGRHGTRIHVELSLAEGASR